MDISLMDDKIERNVILTKEDGCDIDVIIIDSKNIYIVPIHVGANSDDILAAYMKVSGEGWLNNRGESYTYQITPHSTTLYSIHRKVEIENTGYLGFLIGEVDIAYWWAQSYPIIEKIATVTGAITGIAAITSVPFLFIKWIRNMKKTAKTNDEYEWIHDILRNDSWNISDLSEKLSISKDQAKEILKGFGYNWDSHKMSYIATENTEKLRNLKPKMIY